MIPSLCPQVLVPHMPAAIVPASRGKGDGAGLSGFGLGIDCSCV